MKKYNYILITAILLGAFTIGGGIASFKQLGGGTEMLGDSIGVLPAYKTSNTPFTAIVPRSSIVNLYAPTSVATSSAYYANTFCINNSSPDCITAWPTGTGGGSTTTITTNILSEGNDFTFTTSSATGLDFRITGSGSTINFTPALQSGYNIPLTASTSNWNTSYLWGDHSTQGYLTSFTESDPIWLTASSSYLTTTTASLTYQPIGSYLTGNQTITLSGEVTGTGATSISTVVADNIIDEANLKVNTAVDDYVLTASSTSAGGMIWKEVAGSGTVTSVDMSVPTGLAISGNPITGAGTLALALDTGYVIPLQSTLDTFLTTTTASVTYQPIGSYLTSAITSLGGQTGATQTFSTSTSGGLSLFINSATNNHQFTLQPSTNYSVPLTASTTNWNTAYGWGNHATAGYLQSVTSTNMASDDFGIFSCNGSDQGCTLDVTYLTGNETITLSGDVSGTGATAITTTIGAGKVTEAMLNVAGSPTDDYYLVASSTSAGGFIWKQLSSSGITSLGGQTGATQTFASSTTGNLQLFINSTGDVHTFTLQPATNYQVVLTASTTEWAAAYTYSQVGHLPLAGGIVAGALNASSTLAVTGGVTLYSTLNVTGKTTLGLASTTAVTATTFYGALVGNASTATALASDPSDCGANTWATTIAANGNLTCGAVTYAGITAMTSANFAGLISDETGTAGTVVLSVGPTFTGNTTLANASTTNFTVSTNAYFNVLNATGKTTLGLASTTAVTATTFYGSLQGSSTDLNCTDCINATEIEDIYLLLAGDSSSGNYVFSGQMDLGGATFLEIPNGTAPTANDPGELAHDTSDNMLILDDYVVGKATQKIWSVTVASTSPAFISAGLLPAPVQLDGYTITAIRCFIYPLTAGLAKTIAVEDSAGNSSEDIVCSNTVTSDDGSITNAAFSAAEIPVIDFGVSSGTPQYVTISVFGTWTRE